MQPAIRQYYHLEEIWGDKPVRLKLGSAKPVKSAAQSDDSSTPKEKKAEKPVTSLRRASAAKTAIRAAEQEAKAEKLKAKPARKTPSRAPARKTSASGAAPAKKVPVKKIGAPLKKAAAKKAPARKSAAPRSK
jgi:ribosome-associated protein